MNTLEDKPFTILPLPPGPVLLVLLLWAAAAQPQPAQILSCSRFQDSILLMFPRSSNLASTGAPASFLTTSGPTSREWQHSLSALSYTWCTSPKPSTEEIWIHTQLLQCWYCSTRWYLLGSKQGRDDHQSVIPKFKPCFHHINSAWKELRLEPHFSK